MTKDPTFWILARAGGIAAYVLLTTSVLAGLVVKARPFGRALKAATALDLHRTLAFLGLGFVAVHGASLFAAHFRHSLADRFDWNAPIAVTDPGS